MQFTIGKGKSAQNAKEKTSTAVTTEEVSADKQSDKGIKEEEKRQKKIIPKNRLYSDQAIAVAKAAITR